jgi:voltage-gated potassium channel
MIETRANFSLMLVGLILLWSAEPIMTVVSTDVARIALYLTIGLALCLGAWSLARDRRFFLIAAALTVLGVISAIMAYVTGGAMAKYLTLVSQIVFWAMCAWYIVRYMLAGAAVNRNHIAGSICLYLIAGTIWALVYILIIQLNPEAFNGLENVPFEGQLSELMYFSMVTLTTLGYGDVTPASPYARWLAQVEAVFGQLYIAILVATLVGIRIAAANKSD